jgi:EmrB/QacA subfamily drug resistance transporter
VSGVTPRERWLVLATVLVGTFIGTVNNSVANVAVLDVIDDFHVDVGAAVWFITGYVLAFAVLMPVAGRLADAYGVRRVYLGGMACFLVASVAVAVAPTYPLAAGGRVLQGVANAPVLPTVMVTIAAVFPPGMRGRAMGLWAAVNGIAIALGPSLGGVVTDALGWRWAFWFDVPIVVLALVLGRRYVPDLRGAPSREGDATLDVLGGALMTGGLVGVMVALSQGTEWGWTNAVVLVLLASGVALLVAFWRRSARVAVPFLDLAMLRNRRFGVLAAIAGLQMAVLYGVLFTVPLVLVSVFDRSVGATGGLVVVLPLSMIVAGPTMGHLTDRLGIRRLAAAGGVLLVVAALVIAAGVAADSLALVLVGLVVVGAGVSAIQSPTAVGVTEEIGDTNRGVTMGMFHTIRFLAGVLGTAGSAALFTAVGGGGDLDALSDSRLTRAFTADFVCIAAVAVVATVLSRLVPRWSTSTSDVTPSVALEV